MSSDPCKNCIYRGKESQCRNAWCTSWPSWGSKEIERERDAVKVVNIKEEASNDG